MEPSAQGLVAVESNSLGPEQASDPELQVFPWMVTGQATGQAFRQLCDRKALWVENVGAFFFLGHGIFGNSLGYMPKRKLLVTVRPCVPHFRMTIFLPRGLRHLTGRKWDEGREDCMSFLPAWGCHYCVA